MARISERGTEVGCPVVLTREQELHFRRAPEPVQPVAQAHDRMFPEHARAGKAHHDLDLFASRALIAMDRALSTGRFF